MITAEDSGGVSYGVDDLGEVARLRVDTSIFSLPAIFKTAYWCTERFYLYLHRESDAAVCVELRSKGTANRATLETACRDFANALLDQQVRQQVIVETGGIRDALLRKAFGEGAAHLDPNALGSDESALPQEGESRQHDKKDISHPTGA